MVYDVRINDIIHSLSHTAWKSCHLDRSRRGGLFYIPVLMFLYEIFCVVLQLHSNLVIRITIWSVVYSRQVSDQRVLCALPITKTLLTDTCT